MALTTLIRREFEVACARQRAWDLLARLEEWPLWARHIRRIEATPPGPVGPQTAGRIVLRNGIRSTFHMTEFEPPKRWKWVGPFAWLTVHYDHVFEEAGADRSRLIWVVEAEGIGVSVIGRLFAAIYSRNLDQAIPRMCDRLAGNY